MRLECPVPGSSRHGRRASGEATGVRQNVTYSGITGRSTAHFLCRRGLGLAISKEFIAAWNLRNRERDS